MKKIVNDVNNVEEEMIQGLVKSAPKKLRKLDYGTIVVRADKKEGKVALVSGGGSGHEPAHAGYVGTGMLDYPAIYKVLTEEIHYNGYITVEQERDPRNVATSLRDVKASCDYLHSLGFE